jgi:hypothetical protein
LELFIHHRPAFMTHVLLSHLSKENNTPQLAAGLFAPHANGTEIIVASRNEASAVYTIAAAVTGKTVTALLKPVQLGLF